MRRVPPAALLRGIALALPGAAVAAGGAPGPQDRTPAAVEARDLDADQQRTADELLAGVSVTVLHAPGHVPGRPVSVRRWPGPLTVRCGGALDRVTAEVGFLSPHLEGPIRIRSWMPHDGSRRVETAWLGAKGVLRLHVRLASDPDGVTLVGRARWRGRDRWLLPLRLVVPDTTTPNIDPRRVDGRLDVACPSP